ncbi:MAG: DNA-3-methyladenine glycosylase 2 family protein [Myxococcota bacterium]
MTPDARRDIAVSAPLDLPRTVGGTALWGGNTWIKTAPGEAWFARHTPEGPATVHLTQVDPAVVRGEAWGTGAQWLLDQVPGLMGAHDDPSALVPEHPRLKRLLQQHPGLRLGRSDLLYEGTMRAAMAAGAGKREGKAAMWRMASAWGEPAPGPRDDLTLFPEPVRLARRSYAEFHPLGLSRKRAELAMRLARAGAHLERIRTLATTEIDAHLQAIPGIGPWTSGVIRLTVLGDPDAVPIGDPNLPNMVATTLVGERRATTERMLELLEPYTGQRGRVVKTAKAVGPKPDRRGPKAERRDIRRR